MSYTKRINDNVYIVKGSIPQIRYSARTCTIGAEYELVQHFLENITTDVRDQIGNETAIFIEPQLDSGYPDVVIVHYSMKGVQCRHAERNLLTPIHLKVLSEIDKRKKISFSHLAQVLGFDMPELEGIIDILQKAGLLHRSANLIFRTPYRDYFCIKKIIAVEAKIDKWAVAIDQAVNNTRFANESYILMKRDKCALDIERRCKELGIGVLLMNGQLNCAVKASRGHFTKPYISFLFNEWIQQLEEMEG